MRHAAALLLLMTMAAAATASPARVLMLGEVHDNAAGHAARLELLRARVDDGLHPALVMEQFDREQQPLLDAAVKACKDADCLIAKAGLADWDWPLYRPLIQFALDRNLPLIAANVSREDGAKAMRGGVDAVLDAATRARFRLDAPLPADIEAEQLSSVMQGHCNMLPESAARKMIGAQLARDVWMAKMLADAVAQGGTAVLIAGNGHVRRDVGVIRWLPEDLAKATEIHGFVEGETVAGEFDVVHRLKPQERPDPCAAFAKGRQ